MHPTIPATTDTDALVRGLAAALVAIGAMAILSGLGVLKRRRRERTDVPSPTRIALGVVVLAGGLVLKLVRGAPIAEADVISPQHFSSQRAPTLALDAPPGWTLAHDAPAGKLVATGPDATLMLETSIIRDAIDPKPFFDALKSAAESSGGTFEGPGEEMLAGRQALAAVARWEGGSSVAWHVRRGGPLLTIIACRTTSARPAREACREILATLRWRAPGPL